MNLAKPTQLLAAGEGPVPGYMLRVLCIFRAEQVIYSVPLGFPKHLLPGMQLSEKHTETRQGKTFALHTTDKDSIPSTNCFPESCPE